MGAGGAPRGQGPPGLVGGFRPRRLHHGPVRRPLRRDVGALRAAVGAAHDHRAPRVPGDERVRRALSRPLRRGRGARLLPAARGLPQHDGRDRPGPVAALAPGACRSARALGARARVLRPGRSESCPRASPGARSSSTWTSAWPATGSAATGGASPRRAGSRTRPRRSTTSATTSRARTRTPPPCAPAAPPRAAITRSPRRASAWPPTRRWSSSSSRPCSPPPRPPWSSPRITTSGSTWRATTACAR